LFPAALGKTGKLSRRPLVRTDATDMLKRRLKQAGLPAHYSPHSFRATGITNFLENDGTLEAARRIAGHADSRTTKLYDRRGQKVLLEDMCSYEYIRECSRSQAMVPDFKAHAEITVRADFNYRIMPDAISIIDTGKGRHSVTADIEAVLRKIEYWCRTVLKS
jgi:hypothetical protein